MRGFSFWKRNGRPEHFSGRVRVGLKKFSIISGRKIPPITIPLDALSLKFQAELARAWAVRPRIL
jgi:hypothetical protein